MANDRRPYARDNKQERIRHDKRQRGKTESTGSRKFVANEESVENRLKQSTIGLVKLEDFQRIKGELEEERQRKAAKTLPVSQPKARKPKPTARSVLSFDEDEEVVVTKARKNPHVDTSFLPDKERDLKEAQIREELRLKWLREQEAIKQEPVSITYSYWDGSGHRKQVVCKKGDTIGEFLFKCKAQVPELRSCSADALVYVKEDLIIPHHYTFYDFIINKARGKSGPLFNFDVHDDVRLTNDAQVEKDDSHAAQQAYISG
ncbi:hypothetical protein EV183_004340 [Coemansia sp. RSA 2336]|nr:hypothetical protein EV183_004340 [Coemansia sp. RSA 2336]